MKDTLLNIIEYTTCFGNLVDTIKVIGTSTDTDIHANAEDKTLIIKGKFVNPIAEFEGTFGMPNLTKLKTILSFDDYDDKSKITVNRVPRDNENVPEVIHFATSTNDFVNDYRLMLKNVVEEKVKSVLVKIPSWAVEFEPSVASIIRLKKQAQANSDQTVFSVKTDNANLVISFGDITTHSGNFIFASGVTGTLSKKLQFPANVVISILNLAGDKKMRISDHGAMEITVDSGLAKYTYLIPAQGK